MTMNSSKKNKDKGKALPQSIPPSSTVDPASKKQGKDKNKGKDKKPSDKEKKEYIDKERAEAAESFQDELSKKKREHDMEVKRTMEKIRLVNKDSERLRKKQIYDYGMTLDMMAVLREELSQMKQQNEDLLQKMTDAKDMHDKLEAEHCVTKERFEEATKTLKTLKKESKTWPKAEESLQKSEDKCQKLVESNKRFRLILLKRRINPTLELQDLERKQHEQAVIRTIPRRRKNFEREILTQRSDPMIKGVSKLYRMSKEDLFHDFGIYHQTLDQVSTDYLGYYWKRQLLKKEVDKRNEDEILYRPGLTLPRLLSKQKLLY